MAASPIRRRLNPAIDAYLPEDQLMPMTVRPSAPAGAVTPPPMTGGGAGPAPGPRALPPGYDSRSAGLRQFNPPPAPPQLSPRINPQLGGTQGGVPSPPVLAPDVGVPRGNPQLAGVMRAPATPPRVTPSLPPTNPLGDQLGGTQKLPTPAAPVLAAAPVLPTSPQLAGSRSLMMMKMPAVRSGDAGPRALPPGYDSRSAGLRQFSQPPVSALGPDMSAATSVGAGPAPPTMVGAPLPTPQANPQLAGTLRLPPAPVPPALMPPSPPINPQLAGSQGFQTAPAGDPRQEMVDRAKAQTAAAVPQPAAPGPPNPVVGNIGSTILGQGSVPAPRYLGNMIGALLSGAPSSAAGAAVPSAAAAPGAISNGIRNLQSSLSRNAVPVTPGSDQSNQLLINGVPLSVQNSAPLDRTVGPGLRGASTESVRDRYGNVTQQPIVDDPRSAIPANGSTAFTSNNIRSLGADFQNLGNYGGDANIYGRRNPNGVMEFTGTGATFKPDDGTKVYGPGPGQQALPRTVTTPLRGAEMPKDRSREILAAREKQLRDASSQFSSKAAGGNLAAAQQRIYAQSDAALAQNTNAMLEASRLRSTDASNAAQISSTERGQDMVQTTQREQTASTAATQREQIASTASTQREQIQATREAGQRTAQAKELLAQAKNRQMTLAETKYQDEYVRTVNDTLIKRLEVAVPGDTPEIQQQRAEMLKMYWANPDALPNGTPEYIVSQLQTAKEIVDIINAQQKGTFVDGDFSPTLGTPTERIPNVSAGASFGPDQQMGVSNLEVAFRALSSLWGGSDEAFDQRNPLTGVGMRTYGANFDPEQKAFLRARYAQDAEGKAAKEKAAKEGAGTLSSAARRTPLRSR